MIKPRLELVELKGNMIKPSLELVELKGNMIKPRLELVKKDYNTKIRTGKGKDNKTEIIRTVEFKGLN